MQFAEALGAAHVPVSLLITYDPTRGAGSVPANVHRYINLYQSSNIWVVAIALRALAFTGTTPATISKTAAKSSTSIWTSSAAFRSCWLPK